MVPKRRTSGRERDVLAVGEVQGVVAIQETVEGEQRFGAGGVQFGEVDERRPAERPGDVTVFPAGLGASLAVAMQLGRPDQGDVANLAGEGNPVVGESEQSSELLDVVVLAGAHVAPDGDVQRYERVGGLATDLLDLGELVEHAEIHVVRVGLGDLGRRGAHSPVGLWGCRRR